MNNIVLSDTRIAGAITAHSDSFTPIGLGLEVCIPEGAQDGDIWELDISPLRVQSHLSSTILGSDVFVSNDQELLSIIRGNLFQCANSDTGTYDFRNESQTHLNHRSTKIATFYNHVFLAIGRTLWWTDLDNYWNWYPSVESEADFRILEWEKDDITAIIVLNDILYIHFPQAIYECVYVGKPSVVRITRKATGAGAINQRSVIANKSVTFFLGLENFYLWSPEVGLKEIGQEVWRPFIATVTKPMSVWAYHDIRNHEICWTEGIITDDESDDTTDPITWAFNYLEGHWTKYSSKRALSHTTAKWHRSFSVIPSSPIDPETSSIIEPDSWEGIENLWIDRHGVYREARGTDGLANQVRFLQAYLETDDLTYGDIHAYKISDLVVFDAKVQLPWKAIRVRAAGKQRVSEDTTWQTDGLWRPGDEHHDFVAVAGKSLRFRFNLVDGLVVADGNTLLDGSQQLTGIEVDSENDGASMGHYFAEIYAWGERVMLPEKLVGPDK